MIKQALCVGVFLTSLAARPPVASAVVEREPTTVRPEVALIDWTTAKACLEQDLVVTCYQSEQKMLDSYAKQMASQGTPPESLVVAAATCSSSLRLYDGTGYTGAVLMLTSRLTGLNLSTYGFDNRTSSYKVGACGTSFYSAANLGGSEMSAASSTSASSMPSGWNNVVSSVWIG